ncbi:sigma factor-like helix-turn-helix DNA-binding protein [Fusobacterium necrophorum]
MEEIGKNFNITRERVRQIEKNTLKKLKRKYTKELRETLL